jgi:hypothetical protein
MVGAAGVTAMDTNAAVTVRVVVPETVPEVAVMTVEPTATAVASPVVLTVATPAVADVHVTGDKAFVEPSL